MNILHRRLHSVDIKTTAALHRRAFPTFFLSSLGESFLEEFYRGFLDDAAAVTVVARDRQGRLQGAVVGTVDPDGFFRRLLVRRWAAFAWAGMKAVVASPAVSFRLIRAVRFRGGVEAGPGTALLSSICVDPECQGQGVGRHLITSWLAEAASRGAARACLATDAEDNSATLRFYESCGWRRDGTFRTAEGRQMHRYLIDLEAHRL